MTTVSTIVTADSKKDGGIGHVRLEWPVTIRWNERSRSFGIGGHVGVEYASLASDMIEPLRIQVDRLCWDLCREQRITARHFTRDGEACRLSKAGRRHFYQAYEAGIQPARRALRRAAMTLARRFAAFDPTGSSVP